MFNCMRMRNNNIIYLTFRVLTAEYGLVWSRFKPLRHRGARAIMLWVLRLSFFRLVQFSLQTAKP